MKVWVTLFTNEWKANRSLFLFVLVLVVGLESLGAYYYVPNDMFHMVPALIPFVFALLTCVVAPPFMLSHSFTTERRSNTHYLCFSLPVRISVSSLCKYLAIASMGCALYAIVFAGMYLTEPRLFSQGDLRTTALPIFLGYLVFWLGIAFVMSALRVSVRRFPSLISGVFFVMSLYVFFRLKMEITMFLFTSGRFSFFEGVWPGAYGLILLVIGLVLFETRAEI